MYLNQRFGLTIIIATLLVMVATTYILSDYQRGNREISARAQSLDLARLLGGMHWNELVPESGQKSFLDLLKHSQSDPDFAYSSVVDLDGNSANEITRPGVIVPTASISDEPTNWVAQRLLSSNDVNQQLQFIESHAPVFEGDIHKGFVKVGYYQPTLSVDYFDLPFLASLLLPIFLLVPFYYFMLRREIVPLQDLSKRFEGMLDQSTNNPVELKPNQALSDFMDQFSQHIEATQSRMKVLNEEHDSLTLSSKLLTYKNNRVDAILQNFPDAILVFDEAAEVSYANNKFAHLLDIDVSTIIGKKTREWCKHPEITPLLTFGDINTHINTNQDTVLIKHGDGEEKSLQFNVFPLFMPNNEDRILGRLVVVRDVSENHQIRQRQNEFISHVSHELKTPLNVLSMYSESLLTEGADDEEYRIEAVNVIHDEVERLSTLINNLLAMNQYEFGGMVAQRNHVRMHDFLADAFQNVTKTKSDKNLVFETDLPHEMSMAYIDKDLFRIAVYNLLTNAIKYNKPGGKVMLSASEDDDSIKIVVSDEGYGIAEDEVEKIFTKFFRSNDDNIRQQTGHGLGLSLAHQIVSMHHGELSCTSELGKGSQFTIKLEKVSSQISDAVSS